MTHSTDDQDAGFRLRLGIWAGAALAAVALGAIVIASGYQFGTFQRMGAGFFPMVLSGLLLALGIAMVVVERNLPPEHVLVRARPILCILGAILAFSQLIRPAGLYPAVIVSVTLAALAQPGRRPLPTLLLGLGIATFIAGIFVFGLNVPVPLGWW